MAGNRDRPSADLRDCGDAKGSPFAAFAARISLDDQDFAKSRRPKTAASFTDRMKTALVIRSV
jgi:hypothetical protein